MSKQEFGRSCGTCARPFTVFRWNPGEGGRFKTTVICQTCAKVKNICQTCLLDLEYGLPTQVRDTALGVTNDAPTSDINREYYAQNMESKMQDSGNKAGFDITRTSVAGKEMLKQLARSDPFYKRNRPKVCSFFAKGTCSRGTECPYRHELPAEGSQVGAQQSIANRYHGNNDPVATKLMATYAETQGLAPPADTDITSLFLSSLPADATEASVRAAVVRSLPSLDPQKIRSIVHVAKSRCAFANFKDRASAELAAFAWAKGFEVDGQVVAVKWGRSRPAKPAPAAGGPSGSAVSAES